MTPHRHATARRAPHRLARHRRHDAAPGRGSSSPTTPRSGSSPTRSSPMIPTTPMRSNGAPCESKDSVLVPWPFDPLPSWSRRRISVRVAGPGWSVLGDQRAASRPRSGARTIGRTGRQRRSRPAFRNRPLNVRSGFAGQLLIILGAVIRARLYVSALGVYTVTCNGAALGDEVLAPGWTSYRHRLRYATLDVTDAIGDGDNVLGITVAEGWYRGRLGFHGGRRAPLRRRHRSGRPTRTVL